jgi:hypothetical protein
LGLAIKIDCTGKMQPCHFDNVKIKRFHLDISINGRKTTEAKLGLDKTDNLIWERFSNMKGISKKTITQANKHIDGLIDNQKNYGEN